MNIYYVRDIRIFLRKCTYTINTKSINDNILTRFVIFFNEQIQHKNKTKVKAYVKDIVCRHNELTNNKKNLTYNELFL